MLLKNKDGLYECLICHNFTTDNGRSLANHVRRAHGKDSKTYYDEYCKLNNESVCQVCGKPTQFRSLVEGYRNACSSKCSWQIMKSDSARLAERLEKTKATCLERYGTTNGGASKVAQEKAQQTNLAKRGVRFASQDPSVKQRTKDTCVKRYGSTTFVHSDIGKQVVKETNLERFGRECFFGGEEGKKASREAYRAKHGVDHNMQDPIFVAKWKERQFAENGGKYFVQTDEFKTKSKETQFAEYGTWYSASNEGRAKYKEIMLAQHGVEEYFQSDDFKNKAKETLLEKYNVDNYAKTSEWKRRVQETSKLKYGISHYCQSQEYKSAAICKYDNMMSPYGCHVVYMHKKDVIEFHCQTCDNTCKEQYQFIIWRTDHGMTPCTHCLPKNPPVSVEETDVTSYIESLGQTVTHYDRDFLGSYGADIVIETNKTIIEYDGVYWHSELYKDEKYHLRKKLLAEEKGYRLIHIFSDEWIYKNDIVKSRLRYLFGLNSINKVYARQCDVRDVDSVTARDFLEHNHIQGNVNSSVRYGLYHEGKLVSLMTFGSSRFESGVTELLRFCSDRDLNVVGGAGKLFNAFIKDHPEVDHIVSYADARWSTGHAFYEKLGFEFTAMSSPGYYIVDGDIRRNRMQFQKHKIAGPGDEDKSEHEITLERGLFRIYDCGQYRYDWKR